MIKKIFILILTMAFSGSIYASQSTKGNITILTKYATLSPVSTYSLPNKNTDNYLVANNTLITINNTDFFPKKDLINYKGRLFYPLGEFAKKLNASVFWNDSLNSTSASILNNSVTFFIDKDYYMKNNIRSPLELDEVPFIYKNSIYVPIRHVAESLGYIVSWDDNKKNVVINSNDYFLGFIYNIDFKKETDIYIIKSYLQTFDTIKVLLDLIEESEFIDDKRAFSKALVDYAKLVRYDTMVPSEEFIIYYYGFLEIINNVSYLASESLLSDDFYELNVANRKLTSLLDNKELLDIIGRLYD